MYYILYQDENGKNTWELVSGEDAMQVRVSELASEFGLADDDIVVFDADDQL